MSCTFDRVVDSIMFDKRFIFRYRR